MEPIEVKKILNDEVEDGWENSYSPLTDEQLMLFYAILLKRNYTYLSSGRHRHTFLSPNKDYVVKVPRNSHGFKANRSEAWVWRHDEFLGRSKLARCKLHKSGILVMECVQKPMHAAKEENMDYEILDAEENSWANDIDCCQVGLTRTGKLVAFDYA